MDAFSVSMANGLSEPCMGRKKMFLIAGVFAFFQALMPLFGWVCVHNLLHIFKSIEGLIPWAALFLLCFIGGKMLSEGIKNDCLCECSLKLGIGSLLVQGVATSIDALSVGFTIADYNLLSAIVCAAIIAFITFFICFAGVLIGKKFGVVLANKSQIFGGVILILIGLEIFITGIIK